MGEQSRDWIGSRCTAHMRKIADTEIVQSNYFLKIYKTHVKMGLMSCLSLPFEFGIAV